MRVKLEESVIELFDSLASKVNTDTNYYYMPYWFRQTDEEGIYEIVRFERLPQDVKDLVHGERNISKETQRELTVDIMRKDEEDGLYDLSEKDAKIIADLAENPPPPNEKLKKAAKEYKIFKQ